MSLLHRGALVAGAAASLLTAVSVAALEAGTADVPVPQPRDSIAGFEENHQAVALVSGGVAAKPMDDPSCPKLTVAPKGAARVAEGAQATLDGLARDCANLGAETICKIALVGESERDKAKGSAEIEAPMTIQVRDAEGRDVETRRVNLKVEMPEGVEKVAFRHVEEGVSLPPPTAEGYADWTIVVGFEPSAEPVVAAAAEEEEAERAPVAAPEKPAVKRSAKGQRSRSARSRAVSRARSVASRRKAAPQQPQQPPVVVTAKPQGHPATVTTTTPNTGSAMARAAQSFTERRDKALAEDRVRQAQEAARQRQTAPRPPQPQASRARPPGPQADARRPQTFRTAQTQ
jgi:hypothetical protein